MQRLIASATALALSILCLVASAHASPQASGDARSRHRAKPATRAAKQEREAREVYDARSESEMDAEAEYESEGLFPGIRFEEREVSEETPAPQARAAGRSAALRLEPVGPSSETRKEYDYVNPAHRDSIADRLVYVEALLLRHGRAYDYRVHTGRELKRILERLDGARAPGRD